MTQTPINALSPLLATSLIDASAVLADVFDGHTPELAMSKVPPSSRPAVMDLSLATLRDYGRGDFFLDKLLSKPLVTPAPRTTHQLRALLLMAFHRLETRPAEAHTTVDQTVNAAKKVAGIRFVGLVNAVLRNFLRQRDTLIAAADADAVAHGRHPAWWIEQLKRDHPTAWQDILAAGNSHPPMSLRPNLRTASVYSQSHLVRAAIPHDILANGALKLRAPMPVARLPGFEKGLCSVQDAGAQWAAQLLDLHDGQRVLDACAAPGGKCAHMLELADIELLAIELDRERVERIKDNLQRLGLKASIRCADARRSAKWWDGQPIDRILADVPCTASGVVRRHPDAKWLRRATDINKFVALQREIIDALWPTLAPGGKMLYATCSLFSQENQQQIEHFLARHPDARRLGFNLPGETSSRQELSLLPNADHDGFYYALLQKAE